MKTFSFNIKEFDFIETQEGEAFASVSLNPTFRWCKFILTDDLPNLNGHRIPQEEFDNLIRTGIFAPIKMASGSIEEGHENALPLGVITALKKENNYVKGLAALWSEERPEDVELIKKSYDEGKELNLSWEVLYSEEAEEENGVKALRGTALRATTFVGMPAYAGRTPITAVASVVEGGQDSNLEDNTVNEEELKARIAELEAALAEKETLLAEKENFIAQKDSEIASLNTEKEALAEFKRTIEAEREKISKLESIKRKFTDNGIEKSEEYFVQNEERLLGMSETDLDFIIQEFVSFASTVSRESRSSVEIPNFSTTTTGLAPKELGRQLRSKK